MLSDNRVTDTMETGYWQQARTNRTPASDYKKSTKSSRRVRVQSRGTLAQRVHRSLCVGELIFCVVLCVVLLILDVVGVKAEASAARTVAAVVAPKSDVVVITRDNVAQTLKEGKWMVEFYVPWCAHCMKLLRTWEEVATELKGEVKVGKVNCDQERALCQRFHVRGFPTLVHVDNRRTRYYEMSRSKEAICAFAREGYRTAPAVNILKSPFGPVEKVKGVVLSASFYARDRFVEKLDQGVPMWMLSVGVIVVLAVCTSAVALALVILVGGKPKRE